MFNDVFNQKRDFLAWCWNVFSSKRLSMFRKLGTHELCVRQLLDKTEIAPPLLSYLAGKLCMLRLEASLRLFVNNFFFSASFILLLLFNLDPHASERIYYTLSSSRVSYYFHPTVCERCEVRSRLRAHHITHQAYQHQLNFILGGCSCCREDMMQTNFRPLVRMVMYCARYNYHENALYTRGRFAAIFDLTDPYWALYNAVCIRAANWWKPCHLQFSSDALWNLISHDNTSDFLDILSDDNCIANTDDSTFMKAVFTVLDFPPFGRKIHSKMFLSFKIQPSVRPFPHIHTWIQFKSKFLS